jgi:hypothetical protein
VPAFVPSEDGSLLAYGVNETSEDVDKVFTSVPTGLSGPRRGVRPHPARLPSVLVPGFTCRAEVVANMGSRFVLLTDQGAPCQRLVVADFELDGTFVRGIELPPLSSVIPDSTGVGVQGHKSNSLFHSSELAVARLGPRVPGRPTFGPKRAPTVGTRPTVGEGTAPG